MEKLIIKNFKCFKEIDIDINKLTVLVGANGFGKSSVIHALLLIRETIDKTWSNQDDDDEYICREFFDCGKFHIPLNESYDLNLGSSSSIINRDTQGSEIEFKIKYDTETFDLTYSIPLATDELWIETKKVSKESEHNFAITKKEFYYLNAERVGPRINQPLYHTPFLNVGNNGQYTAQVISYNSGREKIEESRAYPGTKDLTLPTQVNSWLETIIPGVRVFAYTDLKTLTSRVLIENSLTRNDPVLATNIGFGISYVLPIVVTGLIAKKGAYFIVENPEAHLHPAAQSEIGRFLAMVSNTGVHVIIETHSDHVLNGIQIYCAQHPQSSEHVTVNFFSLNEQDNQPDVKAISLSEKGELSYWPNGFFDQAQKDFVTLLRLRNNV